MIEHLKTFGKTHLFYIILLVGGVIAFRSWLSEHDARVAAENTVKINTVKVADLQAQINAIPAQTAAKVQVVTRIVHDAQTPTQVVAAVPQLTDAPLNTRTIPGNTVDVQVNAAALVTVLGELKTSQIDIGACQQTDGLKDQQIVTLQNTIKVLQAKPKFWHRVGSVAKAVGIGVGIGVVLGVKL
jgi:hypothetical protein